MSGQETASRSSDSLWPGTDLVISVLNINNLIDSLSRGVFREFVNLSNFAKISLFR